MDSQCTIMERQGEVEVTNMELVRVKERLDSMEDRQWTGSGSLMNGTQSTGRYIPYSALHYTDTTSHIGGTRGEYCTTQSNGSHEGGATGSGLDQSGKLTLWRGQTDRNRQTYL